MEKKSTRKSASKWIPDGERALIEIWGEKIIDLRGCRKNSHILLEMAQELENQGFVYSVMEIKTKMHNLSSRYRNEKKKVGITGGSPSDWQFYKDMAALLAPYKSYHTENLVVDSINNINSSISTDPLSPNNSMPLPPTPVPSSSSSSPSTPSPPPSSSPSVPSPVAIRLPSVPSPVAIRLPSSSTDDDSAPPVPSSSAAGRKKEQLATFLKKIEKNIETIHSEMKNTTDRLISMEEEKKQLLKAYVDKEAEVQNALIEFLKRP